MCLTVSGDETCTVHREDDIFMQKVDIMDDLVVAALQEGRINADHRQHPLAGQTGCKGHGMLFGHADIEEALRMGMTEKLQTCAVFHGGSNGTEVLSVFPAALSVRPKALENDSAGATSGSGMLVGSNLETPW